MRLWIGFLSRGWRLGIRNLVSSFMHGKNLGWRLRCGVLGLNQLMQEAKERGTDIERDCLGLPKSLRLNEAVECQLVRAPLTMLGDRSAVTSAVATPASTPEAGSSPTLVCRTAPAGVVAVRMPGRLIQGLL